MLRIRRSARPGQGSPGHRARTGRATAATAIALASAIVISCSSVTPTATAGPLLSPLPSQRATASAVGGSVAPTSSAVVSASGSPSIAPASPSPAITPASPSPAIAPGSPSTSALPSPSGPSVYELGEFATLWIGSTQLLKIRLESVSVDGAAPSAGPSPGFTEVNFELHYDGFTSYPYGPQQWRARDDRGATYAVTASSNDPLLQAGTLAPGENVNGWVGFIVPEGTPKLWLDFVAAEGQVVFSIGPIGSLP